jgi:hypothetical protein
MHSRHEEATGPAKGGGRSRLGARRGEPQHDRRDRRGTVRTIQMAQMQPYTDTG